MKKNTKIKFDLLFERVEEYKFRMIMNDIATTKIERIRSEIMSDTPNTFSTFAGSNAMNRNGLGVEIQPL